MPFLDFIGDALGFVDDLFISNQEEQELNAANASLQAQQSAIDAQVYATQVNAQVAQENNELIILIVGIAAAVTILFIIFKK